MNIFQQTLHLKLYINFIYININQLVYHNSNQLAVSSYKTKTVVHTYLVLIFHFSLQDMKNYYQNAFNADLVIIYI